MRRANTDGMCALVRACAGGRAGVQTCVCEHFDNRVIVCFELAGRSCERLLYDDLVHACASAFNDTELIRGVVCLCACRDYDGSAEQECVVVVRALFAQ